MAKHFANQDGGRKGKETPNTKSAEIQEKAHANSNNTSWPQGTNTDGRLADSCSTGFPVPQALVTEGEFLWDDDRPAADNYHAFGRALANTGDLYRAPEYGGGLILAPTCPDVPPRKITKPQELAPIIADQLRVRVYKRGKPGGSQISSGHLRAMLAAESFLQRFRPLDNVVTVPMYLGDFRVARPGYNDDGAGQRILYVGARPTIRREPSAIRAFLDVMAFESEADRTNAVAAALTVLFRNHWLGGKPLVAVTSTKSHGGKDTIVDFAAGPTPKLSVTYEKTDWAFQKNIAKLLDCNRDTGVVNIENVRLAGAQATLHSAFLERFLTDPHPVVFETNTGDPKRRRNDIVLATTTNFGKLSMDLMNRALPIRLCPRGDVANRESAIGNPRWEYLPGHRDQIQAELRGLVRRWKDQGRPLDEDVRHPFTAWAKTIGGILLANCFNGFLDNYSLRATEDDPVRNALGLLGTYQPDDWLRPGEWALRAADLSLEKALIPVADRETPLGRERGMGVVLSAHEDETFTVNMDGEIVRLRLERRRRRSEGSEGKVCYRFVTLRGEPGSADDASE